MAYSTCSNAPMNGSADEFAPSSTAPPPRTPVQVAADAALSRQWAVEFVADTCLPVATPRVYLVNTSNTAQPSPTVARTQAARTSIANFDAAFNDGSNDNNDCNTKK